MRFIKMEIKIWSCLVYQIELRILNKTIAINFLDHLWSVIKEDASPSIAKDMRNIKILIELF